MLATSLPLFTEARTTMTSTPIADQELARRTYIDRLTLLDDLFMSLVFEDKRCIELVLRLILGISDLQVEEAVVKHTMANLVGRSAQIDVLAVDSRGRRYDVEVQRDLRGTIPRRARYYGAMLDMEALNRGKEFEDLPETYIVFITERDVFGAGEKVYHVERSITETGEAFDDGLHVLYVNCACPDDGTPLGDLAHDFRSDNPELMRYNILKRKAHALKHGREASLMSESIDRFVEQFKDFWIQDGIEEGRQRGVQEGLAQGLQEGRKQGLAEGEARGAIQASEETARRLLAQAAFSIDDIAAWTGLTTERVNELALSLSADA